MSEPSCDYCATDSPIYATHRLCCAVRFIMRHCPGAPEKIKTMRTETAKLYQRRYGWTQAQMIAEHDRQRGMK